MCSECVSLVYASSHLLLCESLESLIQVSYGYTFHFSQTYKREQSEICAHAKDPFLTLTSNSGNNPHPACIMPPGFTDFPPAPFVPRYCTLFVSFFHGCSLFLSLFFSMKGIYSKCFSFPLPLPLGSEHTTLFICFYPNIISPSFLQTHFTGRLWLGLLHHSQYRCQSLEVHMDSFSCS